MALSRKWSRIITFLSASLVFGTYFAKEVLLDKWRGTVASIETAEDQYEIKQEFQNLSQQLYELEDHLRQRIANEHDGKVDTTDNDSEQESRRWTREAEALDARIELLSRLKVPGHDLGPARQLSVQIKSFRVPQLGKNATEEDKQRVDDARFEMEALLKMQFTALQFMEEDIIRDAQHNMVLAQWWSIGLYLLAGVIGLVVHLLAPTDNSDEEAA